ncbi:MAG: hypothetical protein Q9218_006113 [Villophora microphyllina]
MDYFIDDMLNSRRGSTKSLPTSPSPTEPPFPPFPTLTRKKKTKTVKFPEGTSSNVLESSKASDAVAVPLPETPAQTTVASAENPSLPGSFLTPQLLATTSGPVQTDYFSAAELPPSGETLAVPSLAVPPESPAPAFFTPALELPLPIPELSQAGAESMESTEEQKPSAEGRNDPVTEPTVAVDSMTATTAATEHQQQRDVQPEEQLSAAEEVSRDQNESPPPVLHLSLTPIPVLHSQPAILIGLSGSPSSGKTTVAHLLSAVLPDNTPRFIVHQDDFFIPRHLLVPNEDGELAVDSRDAVNMSAFKRLLEYAKREGQLPRGFQSAQPDDGEDRALSQVPMAEIEQMQDTLAHTQSLQDGRPIGIVEGPWLYQSETVRHLLDVKLLLRATKETSRTRRFEKSDYCAAEPEERYQHTREYFNGVVWYNHVQEHKVLFEDGDVEAEPISRICEGVGVSVQPNPDMTLGKALRWVVEVVGKGFEEVAHHQNRHIESIVRDRVEYEFCNCNEGILGKIRQTIFDIL